MVLLKGDLEPCRGTVLLRRSIGDGDIFLVKKYEYWQTFKYIFYLFISCEIILHWISKLKTKLILI